MEEIIDSFLDLLQNSFLKPEYTYEIMIPIFLSFFSAIGSSNIEFDIQKEMAKIFSLFHYFIYLYRKQPFMAYHELLKIIPYLKDMIGTTDYETIEIIKNLELTLTIEEKNNMIIKNQIILEKIIVHIEELLSISKNDPHILTQSNIHFFILSVLKPNKFDKLNECDIYITKKKNDIYIYFESDKECYLELINKIKIYEIDENTKFFLGGFSIYGMSSILFSISSYFKNENINSKQIYIITIGTPHFCDLELYNSFHSCNYYLLQIIDMKDNYSFKKIDNCIPLTLPLILGPQTKIDYFYTYFFNEKLTLNKENHTKKHYIKSFNNIYPNYFQKKYENNWLLNHAGYFTNVSL